jgi:hypothetical protein
LPGDFFSKNRNNERELVQLPELIIGVFISSLSLNQAIWIPATIIGCITCAVCFFGFEFGKNIGLAFETGSQIIGGLILIGIGVKGSVGTCFQLTLYIIYAKLSRILYKYS